MNAPHLREIGTRELPLLGDETSTGRVSFGFSSRLGGVSQGLYTSLNLGSAVGDDPKDVQVNRERVLRLLGAPVDPTLFIAPHQVHGTTLVSLDSADPRAIAQAQREAQAGADGVVVSAAGVAALICTADCVPVALVAQDAFAVVHSGWRGTIGAISRLALERLLACSKTPLSKIRCYVGPHIRGADYEVSKELCDRFIEVFGKDVALDERHVSLTRAVVATLVDAGVERTSIACSSDSTASQPQKYFSYRAEGDPTGRQGVMAWMRP